MSIKQFQVTITTETLAKMLDNIVVNNVADKKLMVSYLTRVIMKSNNGNDFFMALTNTFPEIIFKPGDRVRVLRSSLWYNIDDDKSIEAGFISGEGMYVTIQKINKAAADCYSGVLTFIDKSGSVTTREMDFNNEFILMDNTIELSKPSMLPGDII
jgi:hypothetical protein